MMYGSLFSGIGGLDRAVEAHFDAAPAWFVERDKFAQMVLAKRWPGVPIFDDVTKIGAGDLAPAQVLVGGFPCTDLSIANPSGRGLDGARSGLFYEMIRLIKEIRLADSGMGPRWIVVENVTALLDWRGQVERAFSSVGYGVTWAKVSAAHLTGCPHLRWRVFLLCQRDGDHRGVCDAGPPLSIDRWATPTARDYKDTRSDHDPGASLDSLPRQVVAPNGVGANLSRDRSQRWATPNASDNRSRPPAKSTARRLELGKQIGLSSQTEHGLDGGRLNADWLESLMGFPVGWTDLQCDEPIMVPFPAPLLRGQWGTTPQLPHEPPRTITTRQSDRTARLRALGNAVVPAQAMLAMDMAREGPRQRLLFGAP